MSFSELKIDARIVKTIERLGYKEPTPVQNKVIPKILRNFDLRISAPTGTGKTAAFLLPSITRILQSKDNSRGAKILILVPTRELAIQVAAQAEKYSKNLKFIKTACIYGGAPYNRQLRELSSKPSIIVATPGRLIDLLDRKRVSLKNIDTFILDEADRMLDMGFFEPVTKIVKAIPKKRQALFLSATLKGNVMKLSKTILNDPLEINVKHEVDKEENIDQCLHYVDDINHKQKILDHLLQNLKIEQAIIFTSTKRQADRLTKNLLDSDYSAAKLHGDIKQRQRTKTIMNMQKGKLQILVATDVAARGIDVRTISHVINFDLPTNSEDYVHRIGRTARAGSTGMAFSFATRRERGAVLSIEKLMGKSIRCEEIKGLEPRKTDSGNRKRSNGNGSFKAKGGNKFNKKTTEKPFPKRKRKRF